MNLDYSTLVTLGGLVYGSIGIGLSCWTAYQAHQEDKKEIPKQEASLERKLAVKL
jgi:hypothetical protein